MKQLSKDSVKNDDSNHPFPIQVKLIDAAVGVIVVLGVTCRQCHDYWPLEFTMDEKSWKGRKGLHGVL